MKAKTRVSVGLVTVVNVNGYRLMVTEKLSSHFVIWLQ